MAMATAQAWMVLNTDPGGDGGFVIQALINTHVRPGPGACITHSNTSPGQFFKRAVHTGCFITAKYRLRARRDER